MNITNTKRKEFDFKRFMGGTVSPETKFYNDRAEPTYRDSIANGVVIKGVWYELPDHPAGEYVLVEFLRTNHYGFYENGGSERKLISREAADSLERRVIRGIVNQLAVVRVSGETVECDYATLCLVRKQGV